MVETGTADLLTWMADRPHHVRATFNTPDKDRPTQCLVLLDLLDRISYPAVADLRDDLEQGFTMHDGPSAAGTRLAERQLGRVIGPCRAPAGWDLPTAAIIHNAAFDTLTDPPAGEVGAAASFPIRPTRPVS